MLLRPSIPDETPKWFCVPVQHQFTDANISLNTPYRALPISLISRSGSFTLPNHLPWKGFSPIFPWQNKLPRNKSQNPIPSNLHNALSLPIQKVFTSLRVAYLCYCHDLPSLLYQLFQPNTLHRVSIPNMYLIVNNNLSASLSSYYSTYRFLFCRQFLLSTNPRDIYHLNTFTCNFYIIISLPYNYLQPSSKITQISLIDHCMCSTPTTYPSTSG